MTFAMGGGVDLAQIDQGARSDPAGSPWLSARRKPFLEQPASLVESRRLGGHTIGCRRRRQVAARLSAQGALLLGIVGTHIMKVTDREHARRAAVPARRAARLRPTRRSGDRRGTAVTSFLRHRSSMIAIDAELEAGRRSAWSAGSHEGPPAFDRSQLDQELVPADVEMAGPTLLIERAGR